MLYSLDHHSDMWKFLQKIVGCLKRSYYVDTTLDDFCFEHGYPNFSYKLNGDYETHSYEYRYINGVPYSFELTWSWDNSRRVSELFKIYSPDWTFTWVSRGLFSNTLLFYIDEKVDNISLETVESDMMTIVLLSDQL